MKNTLNIFLLILVMLMPSKSGGADFNNNSAWKSYDASAGDEFTCSFPNLSVTIKQQDSSSSAPFREDNLIMVVKRSDGTVIKQKFTSTYGSGRIFFKKGYLFLEYGIGRGSGVREEHIRVYTPLVDSMMADTLVEILDIQKSYRVPSPSSVTGELIEYKIKIIEEKNSLRIELYGAKKSLGLPSKKEFLIEG